MIFDWQDIAALGIVAAAIAYLLRQSVIAFRARRSVQCGSCTGCSAASGRVPLVTLQTGPPRQARDASKA
ncbi:MAG: hypothetical protein KJZ87_13825 [Thermoguttaceae bacterium]|nr:hypothetical protein [Thermoguttaceae bacterium]